MTCRVKDTKDTKDTIDTIDTKSHFASGHACTCARHAETRNAKSVDQELRPAEVHLLPRLGQDATMCLSTMSGRKKRRVGSWSSKSIIISTHPGPLSPTRGVSTLFLAHSMQSSARVLSKYDISCPFHGVQMHPKINLYSRGADVFWVSFRFVLGLCFFVFRPGPKNVVFYSIFSRN